MFFSQTFKVKKHIIQISYQIEPFYTNIYRFGGLNRCWWFFFISIVRICVTSLSPLSIKDLKITKINFCIKSEASKSYNLCYLILKLKDQIVFFSETFSTPLIFDTCFFAVSIFTIPPLTKKSEVINLKLW
jgi:hypothetical protein